MEEHFSNKRIARNTIFLYIRMAFVMLVSLYISRVILAVLGVEEYGVYNVVAGFVSMFAFLNTSLSSCIQRFYNFENGRVGKDGFHNVYVTSFFIQALLSILVLVLVETVGLWYLNHKLVVPDGRLDAARILFQTSVGSMIVVIMQVPYSAAIMAKERMDYYAIVGIIDVLLKLSIVVVLKYISYDRLTFYGFLLLGVSIVDFLLFFVYAKLKDDTIYLELFFDKKLFSQMLSFSGWSMLGAFAQVIRNQGLNMVLNLFFGPVVNAARGLSYQVKTALSSFMASVPTSARPQMVESFAIGDVQRSKQILFSISKICFFLIYLLALPLAYEMEYVLHLWLGNNIPEHTIPFSQIILLITIIETYNWPVSMIIYASGRIGWYNVVTSFLGILTIPVSYYALKGSAEPEVAYWISLLISVAVQTASIICMKVVVGVTIREYFIKVLLPSICVVLVTFFIPYIIHTLFAEGTTRFILTVISSMIGISLASIILGLNQKERSLLVSLFRKQ